MKEVVVVGGNFAGLTAAFEVHRHFKKDAHVTLISKIKEFVYIPSLIWVPFGRRKAEDISFDVEPILKKRGMDFVHDEVVKVLPEQNKVLTKSGKEIAYDELVLATGANLKWEAVPGLGPNGHSRSIFTPAHATATYEAWKEFVKNPGPAVVGAVPGASCMGAGYEYLMNLEQYCRKEKIRDKVKVTWITPEPYLGHFGIGGMPGAENLLKTFFKKLDIDFRADAAITEVKENSVVLSTGEEIPAKWKMLVPPFNGQKYVFDSPGLGDDKGFITTDEGYRHIKYKNIWAAGLSVAVPNPFKGEGHVPFGVPKTGYPSDEMGKVVAKNIKRTTGGDREMHFLPFGRIMGLCILDGCNKEMVIFSDHLFEPRKIAFILPDPTGDLGKWMLEKYFLFKAKHGISWAL
ncbi:MAG TPA: FAD-dependent oxidoreductase [Rectinemataceae bacterium]|nr:FAD-dependent oxidoreductase [Rectinemataceae bacterium]